MTEQEEVFVVGHNQGAAYAWKEAARILRRATREVEMPDDVKYVLLSFAKRFTQWAKEPAPHR